MTTVQEREDRTQSAAASRKAPGIKPVLLIAASVLVLTLAGSIWLYQDGTRAIRVQAQGLSRGSQSSSSQSGEASVSKVFKQVDDWALRMIMATAAGGAGVLLATLVGVSWWRRALLSRMADANEFEQLKKELQKQTNERRRLHNEMQRVHADMDRRVEERTAVLTKTY